MAGIFSVFIHLFAASKITNLLVKVIYTYSVFTFASSLK